jgi:hypothetical protein
MDSQPESQKSQKPETIAVIGGGIAGLFCTYILARRGHEVHLFEGTSRLGGRIRTVRLDKDHKPIPSATVEGWKSVFPDLLPKAGDGNPQDGKPQDGKPDDGTYQIDDLRFHAEFGPMRVELEVQELLHLLLLHLGFSESDSAPPEQRIEDFPAFSSASSIHDPQYELTASEEGKNTLQLLQLAILRIMMQLEDFPSCPPDHGEGSGNKHSESLKGACRELKKWQNYMREGVSRAAAVGLDPLPVFLSYVKSLNATQRWLIQKLAAVKGLDDERSEQPTSLYMLGFWNLLIPFLSHDALAKVRDLGSFYHLIPENPNAAEWLAWWLSAFTISDRLKGIRGGMEVITTKLHEKLSDKPALPTEGSPKVKLKVHLHRLEVQRLKWSDDGKLAVADLDRTECETWKKGEKEPAFDRVFLAIPKKPLSKLLWASLDLFKSSKSTPQDMRDLIDCAFGFPLVKVFFVVKRRWWEEEVRANKHATRIPTRELYFWRSQKKRDPEENAGLVMVYTDRPASNFWANYVRSDKQHNDVDWPGLNTENPESSRIWRRLKRKIVRYLNENENVDLKESDIEWVGIRDWHRDPYGGANHAWRPKRRYWVAMARLASIPLQDSGTAHLHVCGEAFSDYHGFMEGALRSSVLALSKVLDPDPHAKPVVPDGEEERPTLEWLKGLGCEMKPDSPEKREFDRIFDRLTPHLSAWIHDLSRREGNRLELYFPPLTRKHCLKRFREELIEPEAGDRLPQKDHEDPTAVLTALEAVTTDAIRRDDEKLVKKCRDLVEDALGRLKGDEKFRQQLKGVEDRLDALVSASTGAELSDQ